MNESDTSILPYFGGGNRSSQTTVISDIPAKTSNISRSSHITFLPEKWSSAISTKSSETANRLPQLSSQIEQRVSELGLESTRFSANFQNPRIHKYEKTNSVYQGNTLKKGASEVPHGNGNLYLDGGSFFTGVFVQGLANGPGRLFLPSGSYYEGSFLNNMISGYGKFVDGQTIFEGFFKNGMLHGRGTLRCPQAHFTGNYVYGEKSTGTLVWGDRKEYIYTGQFLNDLFHGQGSMKTPEGLFEGSFVQGHKLGYGVFNWKNGSRYQGEYRCDLRDGFGEFFDLKGQSQFRGFWKNDLPYGQVFQQNQDPI